METDIWFPFYYGDYLKDTMQLSAERHGIYLLLMIHCWQNEYIDDDIESMCMIAKVHEENKSLLYILDKYFVKKDDKYYQNRITKELKCAKENKEKRVKKAKDAANKRWNNDATSNAPSIPQAMPEGMPESCPSSSSSSSSSKTPTTSIREIESDFEEIYFCYPIKKGKSSALTKYKYFRKNNNIPEKSILIEWINKAIRSDKQWIDGFIPHFSTWMNQRRWEDELPESKNDEETFEERYNRIKENPV